VARSDCKVLLPPGYSQELVVGHREGVWVLKARRGEAFVALRLETSVDAREGLAELAVLSAVEHPGVASLVDYGPGPEGGRFLARRWIEGEDLATWARDKKHEAIGSMVTRLTPALDHLHRAGFVHADLKPENVIVTPDGRPVLCDFGLSSRQGQHQPESGVSGTLFAIAPEVLLGMELTPASDLFALGAMLHRLLVGIKRSAREFYAIFPDRSYLDAAGSDPEDLPVWSRDLIVSLTARDPNRRPRSAAAVGRILGERLGVPLDARELAEDLRWPVAFGRDGWVSDWMGAVESAEAPLWVRTPPAEDPRPVWEHLRLFASLRGKTLRGVDLGSELMTIQHGVALDSWSAGLVASGAEWVAVLVSEVDAWRARALESLERACALQRRKQGTQNPRLFAVARAPAPPSFQARDVPPVSEESIARFLERPLASENPVRRSAFAARLAAAAQGSASRVDRMLQSARENGWLLAQDQGFRLRPGELPDAVALASEEVSERELSTQGRAELSVLCALQVSGGRSRSGELASLAGLAAREFGGACLRLQRDGWIDGSERGEHRLLRAIQVPALGTDALRATHERQAHALELELTAGADHDPRLAARIALHRFAALPLEERAANLARALAALREQGRAEASLELIDKARKACQLLGVDLARTAPDLTIERARAWCALGQTDPALREVEGLAASSEARLVAWVELVRAEVARLRHETDVSFGHYERAADLHESVRIEAAIGRIQLLHTLAKDEETCAALVELRPEVLEQEGRLEPRKRIYLQSLGSMSRYRLGRVEEARAELDRLVAETVAAGDVSLEAALRINQAILERGSGSLERARGELERAADLYDRAGLIAGLAHARANLGGLLRELGELVAAEPLLVSAMEIRERLDDREGSSTVRGMLGLLYFERGHARAAIEALESTAAGMTGAQKRRYAPLLFAKASEMRARLGDFSKIEVVAIDEDGIDPRVLLARARMESLRGDKAAAAGLAARGGALAQSLKQPRIAREALTLANRLDGGASLPVEHGATLSALDEELFDRLRSERFTEGEMERLADELARRGRDDRAARAALALAARCEDPQRSREYVARAESSLGLCSAGLSEQEKLALRRTLLGEPDPWPGDFTPRSDTQVRQEDFEMEIVSLLEINRQLVQQQDLDTLLGLIVEHALGVTGAERGFLVLEEHGSLRFDTALDSCRGDIDQPEFEISGSVVRDALSKMHAVRVSNAVDDPKLGHQTSVVSLELRSILCVPFEISRDLRGAIYVDHRLRKGAFDDRAERLCRLLADQAALAILQVKRLEEIRALNRELERRVVEKEVDLQNARRALREAGTAEPGTLVGQSRAMRKVHELIARAAPSDLAVLIVGESGTGKELAARSLHEQSPRRRAAFVSESCAALPASLIESELFGYRKGSFTGADRNRAGLFEQAAGGSLFLDEIGELPLDLQAKFLRVLETNEVRRIGDDTPHRVDFRLIVATNRDLEREVNQGRFRQDLYYRIAGLQLRMPSLAERAEDIELLVEHFLRLEEASGRPRRRVSKRMLAALARRNWPGNVRELRNEISRLCVLCEGDIDDPALISRPATFGESDRTIKEIVPISELEKRAIHSALEKTGGDKRKAAEMLGISRAKIYQRLKDWEEGKD
jgi:transcriptional regulator with GAF, ATPase, and Fis domain/tRNA A-37 threonylcarbamoyl transferase component Bud32/tetratricopeptide (TPR) repeat protein